jgi:N-acetylmuramoyl-L-alanine amidase
MIDRLIELCIWREARGASEQARIGVYSVIINRFVLQFEGATSIAEVILKPFQFSSFNWTDPGHAHFPRQINESDWKAWLDIQALVKTTPIDNTQGATHYFDSSIAPPSWADPTKKTVEIPPFSFYKLA